MRPIIIAMALCCSMPAWAQVRSRAIQIPPSQMAEPSVPVIRDPSDGDDILEDAPVPAVVHRSYGALGRTVDNTIGVSDGAILIRTSERRLYLGLGGGRMRVYPVAVGKAGAQWHGDAVIGRKAVNPGWSPTARQRRLKHLPAHVRPGPANPLGVRALYLSRNGRPTLYRIHGTNAPASIGRSVSSGCIRMRNADVIDLYARVPTGTRVSVR